MSSVMTLFLFWIMFIHKQECAVNRPDHFNRNAFEYVIQKYMNPLRRLSADLPNHAIEMEIEFHGSVPREVTHMPQRRVIRVVNARHPKKVLRSEDEADPAPPDVAPQTTLTAEEDPQPSVPATSPPPANPTPVVPDTTVQTNPAPADPTKIPIFMEDLKKALEDFEKKLQANIDNATKKPAVEDPAPVPTTPNIRSIDDIMQMLKKAQLLNANIVHRMPKAGDEKLEWLQIKIPKSVKT